MSEGELNLQRRWIEAMCRITCSLISGNGLTAREALLACKGFHQHPPAKPKIKTVKALEFEAKQMQQIPEYIRAALDDAEHSNGIPPPLSTSAPPVPLAVQPKPKQIHREARLNIENYPEPWCKVIKGGKLVRYEDSTGRAIPETLWPKEK